MHHGENHKLLEDGCHSSVHQKLLHWKGHVMGHIVTLQDQPEKNLLSVCSEPTHMKCQFCLLTVQLSHTYLLSWLMLLVYPYAAVFKSVEPVVNSRFLKAAHPQPLWVLKEFLLLTSLVCKRILQSHAIPTETLHWVLVAHVCNTSRTHSILAKSKPSFQQEVCFCQCDWIP